MLKVQKSKFNELVYNILTENTVLEHAFYRKDAENCISDKSYTMGVHIMELYMYDNPTCANKWINEIKSRLKEISAVKVKKNIYVDYYNAMYDLWWNHEGDDSKLEDILYGITNENHKIEHLRKKMLSTDEIRDKLKEIMTQLSELMPRYHLNEQKIDKILRGI